MLFYSPFSPSLFNLFPLALMRHQKPRSHSCDLVVLLKSLGWSFWCVVLGETCMLVLSYWIWENKTDLMISVLHFCYDVRDSWRNLFYTKITPEIRLGWKCTETCYWQKSNREFKKGYRFRVFVKLPLSKTMTDLSLSTKWMW